ncbi:hypothetical protein PR202_ga06178 [Eleusine coracana subsp. coracana]|uniref:Rhodanese domain-containing protein n=1 Tax=Eleusine coracana subsp. coracana TaxID=191504 RepID=A0AAV5BVG8_ELECO|nr:hypothetical protein PR202_ga06178 [Eleusine coracana subsp. coracana]
MCGCSPATVVTVNVTAAKELVASAGLRYLDVRTEEEWSKGHLDDSLNVPYMFITSQGNKHLSFGDQATGCQSGKRSELACVDLLAALQLIKKHQQGFKNVKNMGGGYADWLQNGFPVHNPPRSG